MAWNNVFLKNKFILYGMGISNKKVEEFFKKYQITYLVVSDDKTIDPDRIDSSYIIIKSPGISNYTNFLKRCKQLNILVINDIELFYLLRPKIKYIGITGTCGKTTICTILYNILKDKFNVKVCGNIGIPIFTYIEDKLEYLIIELSSYQLENINKFRVNYYIVLNIYNHHLNHHKTFDNYLNAKLGIINNLAANDTLIINDEISPFLSGRDVKCKLITYSKSLKRDAYCENEFLYFKNNMLNVNNIEYFKYQFNKENFLSIFILLKLLHIDNNLILAKLSNFNNLPHRMEKIYNDNNLIIFNDSKSTSFNSLNAAINYCENNYFNYELDIILGGKIDLEEIRNNLSFIRHLSNYKVYCYGENKLIISKLLKTKYYKNLNDVINNININIDKDQVILFSPAAQSFDEFKSYEDRGEKFKELIFKKLNV